MSERLLLRGARLVGAPRDAGDVLVGDGRLLAIDAGPAGASARTVDLDGLLLAPGFVDLQVNGAAGVDFSSQPGEIGAPEPGAALARHGVTSYLATIVSSPPATYAAALEAWRRRSPADEGAVPIGLHFEGPFLAPGRGGAHAPEHLRLPDPAEVAAWTSAAGVGMVTLAPELPGALDVAGRLAGEGVVVAAGHSTATCAEARRGIDAGVSHATHLFNAMPPLHHRQPGLVAALLLDPRVTIGLIADGRHVAGPMLDLAWRVAGADRVVLVSDATAGLGAPPGRYRLGAHELVVDDDARLGDGTLAGALAGLDVGVRTLRAATGCSVDEAIGTVTRTPARLLGLDDGRGRLVEGGRADLAVLSPGLEMVATLVAGGVAYAADPRLWG